MNKQMLIIWIIVLLFFGFILYTIIEAIFYVRATEESCSKINMEYYTIQDSTFCVDNNGNAHYVIIDCKQMGLFKFDCNPKIINIGDIRTKPNFA